MKIFLKFTLDHRPVLDALRLEKLTKTKFYNVFSHKPKVDWKIQAFPDHKYSSID